jgi:hypothetical protein
MTHLSRISASILLGVALCAMAPHAAASATFPEALRKKLGLAKIAGPPPGCRLCHQDDLGGLKTATKPFARSLIKAGAMATSVPSLLAALDTLASENTDSDGDGIPDIVELKAGMDPNVAMTATGMPTQPLDQVPLPETGCTLGYPSSEGRSWAALAVALLLLVSRRSRSRR